MKFCRRCLYPETHPLGLTLDHEGICSGCRVHEEKDAFDWAPRLERLREIVEPYRTKVGGQFDCVVPICAGKDSWFTMHVVKNVLGLRPLMASYNIHYNTPVGIRNQDYLRLAFDAPLVQRTASPDTVRAVNRATLDAMGSIYWHIQAGRTAFPVQTAINYRIPLIIWGVHQGIDQVGMFSHLEEVEMNRRYRKDHDLMGWDTPDLVTAYPELDDDMLDAFHYPNDDDLKMVGVRGLYLNNFVRWDSKAQHELMIREFGYETLRQARTFDPYNTIYCHHYSGLHDRIKFAKWGYGKCTDHATREIRLKRLARREGADLVRRYADVVGDDEQLFLDWQGMSRDELWSLVDQHRSPTMWARDRDGWILKHRVWDDPGMGDIEPIDSCRFRETGSRRNDADPKEYILIGKGYVHDENRNSSFPSP